jgi:hypothetical protein
MSVSASFSPPFFHKFMAENCGCYKERLAGLEVFNKHAQVEVYGKFIT